MADYQKMYTVLFNALSDAIKLLQQAQQQAEEIYISGNNAIHIVRPSEKESAQGK